MKEVRMPYYLYKHQYAERKKVWGSYDAETKTILVIVPDAFELPEQQESAAVSDWKKIYIPNSEIKKIKGNRYRISMPYHSKHRNYKLFVSEKLIKTNEFEEKFLLINTKSDYAFKVNCEKSEIQLTGAELYEELSEQGVWDVPKLHVPKHLNPVECAVPLKELMDDDD